MFFSRIYFFLNYNYFSSNQLRLEDRLQTLSESLFINALVLASFENYCKTYIKIFL